MSLNTRRIIAYIIDIFIVSIIAGALSVSPLNPDSQLASDYRLELEELTQEYAEQIKSLEDTDEDSAQKIYNDYLEIAKEYNYNIARNSIYEQSISIICLILYYAIFTRYFDSQTFGKRLMKLQITNMDGNPPSVLTLFLRVILLFKIPINILNMILCFTLDRESYYDISSMLTIMTYAYMLSLILMALGRKDRRGIHDLIAGTKIELITK